MRFTELPTPCFIVDEKRLVQNLAVLRGVADRTGAKILLAQKAFSMFSVYPLLREYLAGTTASGLYEARLGITEANFQPELLDGIEGFHFHTLCEQNADDLVRTVAAFEARFGEYMEGIKWLNLGGGHHITRDDYDVETLIKCICYLRDKYNVQIYLEPGEAVVLNAGYLVSTVLEVMHNGKDIAILDTSAACHMPDVLEMPYRPPVWRAGEPGKKAFTYLLTGRSCLAGDVIGEYSFDTRLFEGEQVVFGDMALYTMVKTNTFNGVPLPLIAIRRADGTDEAVRMFDYEDFKGRLS